ncbi:alpha-amylase family glycosyl hydrolase [Sediminibacillus albus]|uniref:Alpha-amylase n=1 Tax=Sediminibacillus albus TaxID=407036 RepID=A0A1G8XCJ0_9BACI|nr:alpha-amylase family glycosyl hydrolase [Sediminibacillus albus]SDJ87635.1 alpha-amylase [Sediminibacillus albus]
MKRILTAAAVLPFLLFYSQTVGAVEQEERTITDESIYYAMVDRYVNGNFDNDQDIDIEDPNAFHGGDIQGIISQLDDLKELGFTAINISPLMENEAGGYHGYFVTDFTKIEQHLGTIEAAKQLIKEAHARDMKVYMDFVINYTAPSHLWLEDNGKQTWYLDNDGSAEAETNIQTPWLKGLPQINLENSEAANQLKEAGSYWLEEVGFDGYRININPATPVSFVADFATELRAANSDFSLIADWRKNDDSMLKEYREAGIDLVIDYAVYQQLADTFSSPGNSLADILPKRPEDQLSGTGVFLDNQNTIRFTRRAVENEQNPITRWKLGLTYLYLGPGTPIVYQGSEVAIDNGENVPDHRTVQLNSGDEELSKYIGRLSAIRQRFPAITEGNIESFSTDGGMAVFKKTYQNESVYVAINNDTTTKAITINDLENDKQLRGLLHDNTVRADREGNFKIGLDRETAEVYIVEKDKGINWLLVSFILFVFIGFVFSVIYLSRKGKKLEA